MFFFYLLCIGTTGVCGGEGAERTAAGGETDRPSLSDIGPEPLRTEPRRSANFAAAKFKEGGVRVGVRWGMGDSALERKYELMMRTNRRAEGEPSKGWNEIFNKRKQYCRQHCFAFSQVPKRGRQHTWFVGRYRRNQSNKYVILVIVNNRVAVCKSPKILQ